MRNPYDRFVSEANYRTGINSISLQQRIEVCKNATAHTNHDLFAHCRPQTDFVGINGDKVDHLFLMFDDGVEAFLHKHGYTLANISKHSHVSEKKWAAADLTKAQREWIEATYADDFNLLRDKFGYIVGGYNSVLLFLYIYFCFWYIFFFCVNVFPLWDSIATLVF